MITRLASSLRRLLNKARSEQELDAELRFHLDRATAENVARGMDPDRARDAARLRLGGVEQIKEECRQTRLSHAWETFLQDVLHGLRIFGKNPGFSLAAILTLALGIGANTAIFSVVHGVLLRPLPYARGNDLVVLRQKAAARGIENVAFSAQEISDYRDQTKTLEAVVEHHSMFFLLLGKDTAERVQTAVVSANFFDVLGVKPHLGRTFVPADDSHSAEGVLVMSYKYWSTRHGGDPSVVGQLFRMNNRPHRVIGVLPPIPQYPQESDVYMPTSHCPARSSQRFIGNRTARMMTAFGRLKSGVPLETAQADLSAIASGLESSYPEAYPKNNGYAIAVRPLQGALTARAQPALLALLGATGLVLLIACANVANLLLARLLRLDREIAVRCALGAGRARLIRQFLTESTLLSLGGGLLGLAIAPVALDVLVRFAGRLTTRAAEITIDGPVLWFTAGVSLLTGILFGLAPALSSTRNMNDTLKQGAGRTTSTANRARLRSGLLVAQVAVSFVLLIAAGLMLRSFARLQQVDPGFRPQRLLSMRFTPNFAKFTNPDQFHQFRELMVSRISELPGVESVALVSNVPFDPGGIASGPGNVEFAIEGRPQAAGELAPVVDTTIVSDAYFRTIRQPMVQGRDFSPQDDRKALRVAVINQTMARHRWPNEDAVGKRISFDRWTNGITIIGVVGDVKEYGLDRPMGDEVYLPLAQTGAAGNIVIRTAGDPMRLSATVREMIRQLDREVAVDRVAAVDTLREESMASSRTTALLLAVFSGLALLISASGIGSVMALAVAQRTHEMGIRLALGASQASVVGSVVRQGLALTLAGTVLGAVGALALTRYIGTLLYATSPTDAATFAVVAALFLAVAAVACLIPAWRVTGIDPLRALRAD